MIARKPRMLKPLAMTNDAVIMVMRMFVKSKEFEVVYGVQGMDHVKILEECTRSADPMAAFAAAKKLEGHNLAMNIPLIWANKKTSLEREEEHNDTGDGD